MALSCHIALDNYLSVPVPQALKQKKGRTPHRIMEADLAGAVRSKSCGGFAQRVNTSILRDGGIVTRTSTERAFFQKLSYVQNSTPRKVSDIRKLGPELRKHAGSRVEIRSSDGGFFQRYTR